MTSMQNANRARPSWFTRFWAVVRYEMLWNIRKKKFIGVIIIAFVIVTLVLAVPVILSYLTGTPITADPNFAIASGGSSFVFFLFALGTAMNSFSSEFENGTIVPLLTKPVSRTMVFLGKLFGAFVIIIISYIILFAYTTVGSIFVYGPQNNLQLMPLLLLGSLISTFIWVALLFAMGAVTKNTILTVLVALGLFLSLFIALPIVSVFAGASPSLNYLPGSGAADGSMLVGNTTLSISTGTDNLGVNLVNYALYPSGNVTFSKIDISAVQAGETSIPTTGVLYAESTSLIALRALGVAFVYIFVFLFIAWIALKRSEIME